MKNLICAVTVLAVSTAQAATIHVDNSNCPGPGDGSVGDPYCSIQTAIDNAVDTDEVVVAPGTYLETINFLGKAVWLHSSDGPEMTIIDGTGHFHVVQCVSGEEPEAVLDGFTITGGNANGVPPDAYGGGMISFTDSSPTVTNCTFTGNMAGRGGGIYSQFGRTTVTNCTFTGNTASMGGAMFSVSGLVSGSPTVTNCTFSENSAADWGGGMANFGDMTVANCTFSGNTAGLGAGMYNAIISTKTVTNCTFSGNMAAFKGGGMYNSTLADTTVTNCMFLDNSAEGFQFFDGGGGMYNRTSNPTVTNCTFDGNTASTSGGGMINSTDSCPTVTNCTFTGNTSGNGGGMYSRQFSNPTVTNCTFGGNTALNGHALAFDSFNQHGPSVLTMTNCILRDGGDEIWNNDGSTIGINYSDVQDGFPGNGNIDADPLFVDPDNGDYRLSAGSPCIDAGDNAAVPEGVLRDLDGNPRFIDSTFVGTMATVDMGAYEYQRSVGVASGDGPWLRDVSTLLGWSAMPGFD